MVYTNVPNIKKNVKSKCPDSNLVQVIPEVVQKLAYIHGYRGEEFFQ